MNDDAERRAISIIEMLLEIPEEDRAEVFAAVRHNRIFCVECGFGSPEHPNPGCHCWDCS